jgi:hypothetical protein
MRLTCRSTWLSFDATIGQAEIAGRWDNGGMAPNWISDEFNRREAEARADAQKLERKNREAQLIDERAGGLMVTLLGEVSQAVIQFNAMSGPDAQIALQMDGQKGFSLTGIEFPVRHIQAGLSGHTVHIRHVTTRADNTRDINHSEIGFSVDERDNVYFCPVGGSRMMPAKVAEELLKPVLFPNR